MNDKDSKLIFEQYLKNIIKEETQDSYRKRSASGNFGDAKTAAEKGTPNAPRAAAPEAQGVGPSTQMTTNSTEYLDALRANDYDAAIQKCPKEQLIDGTFTKAEKEAILLAVSSNYMENAFAPMGASNVGLVPIFKAASSLNPLLTDVLNYNQAKYFGDNITNLNPEIDESKLNAFRSGAIKYVKKLAKFIADNYDKIFFIGEGNDIPTGGWQDIPYHKINKENKNHNIQQLNKVSESADKILNVSFISFTNNGKGKDLDVFSNIPAIVSKFGNKRNMGIGLNPSSSEHERNPLNPKFKKELPTSTKKKKAK